ncbi:cuticle protein 18.7 [Nilaparvata lugens]|uniref:cuticle protein 18.7 n=1 Tax=Nilaparvata lugens TaxID=108931 RepID=UPI00193DB87B|nr:cuticle protein 18.7 [Nilaparvata lugens]
MKFLVALCAVLAVACGKPAAVGYAYSAVAAPGYYPWAHPAAYSPLAYSAPVAAPTVYSAPVAAPAVYSAPVAAPIVAAPAVYSAPVAAPIKSQYHSQDELGQASYGHAEPGQTHNAVQDAAGNKVGSFSYVNADGKLVRTDYVADALGYRVASNDLPAAPAVVPTAPEDTPEVAAAKAAHLAEVAKASSRKRRAAVYPYSAYPYAAYPYAAYPYSAVYPHAYPTTHTVPVVTADGFLADTPEVAHAKAAHFAEHAAAHARGKRSATPVIAPAATTPYIAPYSAYPYSAYPYSAYPYSAYPYSAYPYSAYPYSAYPYSAFYKK